MGRAVYVNATIKPPPPPSSSAEALALAVTATLSLGAEEGRIAATTLKSILFDALVAFLDGLPEAAAAATPAPESADDGLDRGVVPVVLALEASVSPDTAPSSSTVVPLIRSAAVSRGVRAVVDRGRDYWVLERRGVAIHDDESLCLDQPTLDVAIVPLHTVPPPPFIVSSIGIQKSTDGLGKPYVAYQFIVKHAKLEWALAKRFSEFAALHERLKAAKVDDPLRLEAGSLPPLPPSWPKPSTEQGIEERRLRLERYLQALVAAPGVMENPHILGFLGIMNPRNDLPLEDPLRPGRKRRVVHVSLLPTTLRWGDIVLFRCAHVYAGLQRAVTRAEWDHVALVVPSIWASSGFDLLESTGEGVTRYPLMARMRAYGSEFTEAIAIRRLEGPRTPAVRQALQRFVQGVDGKPYGFSLSNFFPAKRAETNPGSTARRGSGAVLGRFLRLSIGSKPEAEGGPPPPQQSQQEEDKFFCSQLVAAGLKAMSVLPTDLNSSRFWPGSFAEGGEIDGAGVMIDPWRLGEVMLVDTKTLELGSAVVKTA